LISYIGKLSYGRFERQQPGWMREGTPGHPPYWTRDEASRMRRKELQGRTHGAHPSPGPSPLCPECGTAAYNPNRLRSPPSCAPAGTPDVGLDSIGPAYWTRTGCKTLNACGGPRPAGPGGRVIRNGQLTRNNVGSISASSPSAVQNTEFPLGTDKLPKSYRKQGQRATIKIKLYGKNIFL